MTSSDDQIIPVGDYSTRVVTRLLVLLCSVNLPPGSSEVFTPAYILVFFRDYSADRNRRSPNKLHVLLNDTTMIQFAVAFIDQTSRHRTPTSILNYTSSPLPQNSDRFLECLPESPTVLLGKYTRAHNSFNQKTWGRNENVKQENTLLHLPQKTLRLLSPPIYANPHCCDRI